MKSIRADQWTGRSEVELEIRSRRAALPSDVKVQLRHKTLLGRGVPVLSQVADPILAQLLPDNVREQLNQLFLPLTQNTQQPAPPCKLQAPQSFQGETLQYPHVKPRP